jgi:hypothetical protein
MSRLRPSLSQIQRWILIIGTVCFALLALVVPWKFEYNAGATPKEGSHWTDFAPPEVVAKHSKEAIAAHRRAEARQLYQQAREGYFPLWVPPIDDDHLGNVHIDWPRVLLPLAVVVCATLAGVLLTGMRQTAGNEKGVDQVAKKGLEVP